MPARQRGAEIVEFIITLPVVLIVLAIIFDFGAALSDQAILTTATRASAIEVIRGATDAEAQQAADRVTQHLLSLETGDPLPTVNVVPDELTRAGADPGNQITVTINHVYNYYLIPAFLAGFASLNLSATTVMNMLPN